MDRAPVENASSIPRRLLPVSAALLCLLCPIGPLLVSGLVAEAKVIDSGILSLTADDPIVRLTTHYDPYLLEADLTLDGEVVLGGIGLACDPVTLVAYALLIIEGRDFPVLVSLDPELGKTEWIGALEDDFESITFDARDGSLLGVTSQDAAEPRALHRIDAADASAQFLCTLEGSDGVQGIAFDAAGNLWHASGSEGAHDPDLGTGILLETITDAGTDPCTTEALDLGSSALIDGPVRALGFGTVYSGDEPDEHTGILWKQGLGEGPLFVLSPEDGTILHETLLTHDARAVMSVELCFFCGSSGRFVRGDVDGDGEVSALVDGVRLLSWSFADGEDPWCFLAADVDGNGTISGLADAIRLLAWGFLSGSPPPSPFPECGFDLVGATEYCGENLEVCD